MMDNNEAITVMVVEDEQMLMKAIVRKLEKAGKKIISCSSAEQALSELKNSQKLPDVIWLDYYLKDMNGLEFMSKLKENSNWGSIPVMVVSNSASADKVTQMLALGVKRYILKAESSLEDLLRILGEVQQTPGGGQK